MPRLPASHYRSLPLAQETAAYQPAGREEPLGLGCGLANLVDDGLTLRWPRARNGAHLDFVVAGVIDIKALGCGDPLHMARPFSQVVLRSGPRSAPGRADVVAADRC